MTLIIRSAPGTVLISIFEEILFLLNSDELVPVSTKILDIIILVVSDYNNELLRILLLKEKTETLT
jgi:hypothetical protein